MLRIITIGVFDPRLSSVGIPDRSAGTRNSTEELWDEKVGDLP